MAKLNVEELKKYGNLIKEQGISNDNLVCKVDGETNEFLIYSTGKDENGGDILRIKRVDTNDIDTYNTGDFEFEITGQTLENVKILVPKLDEFTSKRLIEILEQSVEEGENEPVGEDEEPQEELKPEIEDEEVTVEQVVEGGSTTIEFNNLSGEEAQQVRDLIGLVDNVYIVKATPPEPTLEEKAREILLEKFTQEEVDEVLGSQDI